VVNTFDAILGVEGTANGYYTVNFSDGSELWVKFAITAKVLTTGKVTQKGTAVVIGGKGRYAQAKEDGTLEGGQSQSLGLPGEAIVYIDDVINFKE
jgi:hypothetical protein